MKFTSELIKINRVGYFTTENHTPFQCTTEGWDAYKYQVTITARPVLDKSGFLIDHASLHKTITEYVESNEMSSCEVVLGNLCHILAEKCVDYGVQLKRLELTISPAMREHLINKNGELRRIVFTPYEMPAFGQYICER